MSGKVGRRIRQLIGRYFRSQLLPTQLRNLTLVVCAMLCGDQMRIATLSRNLPLATSFHHRQKRLLRFLANQHVQPQTCFLPLLRMILALQPRYQLIPVVVDQTTLPLGYEAIFASIPYLGRALPFAFVIFQPNAIRGSQNQLECDFFAQVAGLLQWQKLCPVLLLDRGYSDVKLIRFLRQLQVHYVIRVEKNVYVRLPGYQGSLRGLLQTGVWTSIHYHKKQPELVNLAAFWGKDRWGNQEMIYLVTDLGPELARERYRLRMRIEEGFKDLKHGLGFKYLRLKLDPEVRLGRLALGAMVTIIMAGWLYAWAVRDARQVTKRVRDQSFVQLVVAACRYVWYLRAAEFG